MNGTGIILLGPKEKEIIDYISRRWGIPVASVERRSPKRIKHIAVSKGMSRVVVLGSGIERDLVVKLKGELGRIPCKVVDITPFGWSENAKRLLSATVARMRLYEGPPEAFRVVRTDGVRVYEPVAFIKQELCTQCGLCASICPFTAIKKEIEVNRPQCLGCGACVTACPSGAIILPGSSPKIFEAVLEELFGGNNRLLLIAINCWHYNVPTEEAMLLKVPPGMVTPALIISAFLHGAAGVAVVSSSQKGHENRALMAGIDLSIKLSKRILDAFGMGGERVAVTPPENVEAFSKSISPITWKPKRNGGISLEMILKDLKERCGIKHGFTFEDPNLSFGEVEIDSIKCTTCGLCALACPIGALKIFGEDKGAKLSFRYQRCVGCGFCTAECPERAIEIKRIFDLEQFLKGGEETLIQQDLVYCAACGIPFASKAVVEKIAKKCVLGVGFDAMMKLCPECRTKKMLDRI